MKRLIWVCDIGMVWKKNSITEKSVVTTAVGGCLKMSGSWIRSLIVHGGRACRSASPVGMSVSGAGTISGFRGPPTPFFSIGCA